MNPSLLGYAAAVLAGLDDAGRARVADELAAIERAATADPALRAALTDTSVAAGARRAVLAEVLEGKVSAPAARIAAYAAFSSHAQDVPASLADAAQRARHAADAPEADEPPLSVSASRRRVGGYADAVFEDLDAEGLDGTEDELFAWARAVESNAALRAALTNRDVDAGRRAEVVASLLSGRASDVTLRLASYAVVGGRARDLVGTLDWLVDRVAEERGWRVARVRTARPIDEPTQGRLAQSLQSLSGRPVELEIAEQPDLLGGVLVELGDLRVDATMRRRLETLREHLTLDRRPAQSFDETTQGVS
jgi:F-type H+-transporting ATPase subunit delta